MMKAAFVAQSCADIQRKLQKLEEFGWYAKSVGKGIN